ncbi:head-tail adaptor protein [Roseisolibacter sp. H3M3-2]|uniref:head-tail adaptor protein n=1 Tax=Roseisolibacter sp. H3M3-2 TaxID=3031323 RepID=UPI0023DA5862|nr:head-tail adaptor protein [Roseisolibacter sp. H3M3-2]MDF1506198.1 head-tail adaptor protein [Roseisolibacter sp. H3M3-2]
MALAAGRLRHRVALCRPVEVETPSGYRADYEDAAVNVACEVTSLGGREALLEKVQTGVSVFRIVLRWRADLRTDWQVRLADGRKLNIRSAEDESGHRESLVIIADSQATLP